MIASIQGIGIDGEDYVDASRFKAEGHSADTTEQIDASES
jgi:hypothetical protein